jgi:hypothetical protein
MKHLLSVLILAIGVFISFSASAENAEINAYPATIVRHYAPSGIYTLIPSERFGVGLGAYLTFESIAIVPTEDNVDGGGKEEVGWQSS